MKKYKAVLFDLFTTLTTLTHVKGAPGRFTHEILDIPREIWTEALFNKSRQRLTGVISDPLEVMKDVAWKIDPWISEELLKEAARERRIRFRYCLEHPPEGVVEALKQIRDAGYRMALVSNADVTEVEAWSSGPMAQFFDEVVFSCHEGFMKPEHEIFHLACSRLGVVPSECLYVGDGGNSELIASAEVGMTAVLTSQFLKDSAPHLVEERKNTVNHHILHLKDILPLIKTLEG